MSIKWFSPFKMGFNFSAIGKVTIDNEETSEASLRGIVPIGHKIFSDNNLTGYYTFGAIYTSNDSGNSIYSASSIGIEFAFSDPIYFNLEVGIELFELFGESSFPSLAPSWSTGIHFYF